MVSLTSSRSLSRRHDAGERAERRLGWGRGQRWDGRRGGGRGRGVSAGVCLVGWGRGVGWGWGGEEEEEEVQLCKGEWAVGGRESGLLPQRRPPPVGPEARRARHASLERPENVVGVDEDVLLGVVVHLLAVKLGEHHLRASWRPARPGERRAG